MANSFESELNLIEYWEVIKKWRLLISGVVVSGVCIAFIYSLVTPKMYKTEATFMPLSGQGPMASDLGQLASLAGIHVNRMGGSPQLLVLLNSKSLAKRVVQRSDLVEYFFKGQLPSEESIEDAASFLVGSVIIADDDFAKNSMLKIVAHSPSPQMAAQIANGYLEELQAFIQENAFTSAKRNRQFIDAQLKKNKMKLLEAAKLLNAFYTEEKISSVEAKVDVPIDIIVKEEFDEDRDPFLNPELKRLEQEKSRAGEMIKQLETASSSKNIVVKDVPQQVYLQYLTLQKEILTQINSLLSQQYEMSKIEEAKQQLAFTVVDPAVVPKSPYKPRPKIIISMAFISSVFLGIFSAFALEYMKKLRGSL